MNRVLLNKVQTTAVLSASYLPLMFFTFPTVAVKEGGISGLWSVIGVTIVGVILGWIHASVNQRLQAVSGAAMPPLVLGKWIGSLTTILYLPVYILFVAISVYGFAAGISSFLPRTPTALISISMIVVAVLGAWYGLETLARSSFFLYTMAIFMMSTILLVMCFRGQVALYTMIPPANPTGIFKSIYSLLPLYYGFSIVLMLNPHYQKHSGAKWIPIVSSIPSGILILLAYVSCVSNFGWELTKELQYPVITLIRLINIHGWLVERSGIVAVMTATAYEALFLSCHIWALSSLVSVVSTHRERHFRQFVIPVSILVLVAVVSLHSDVMANLISEKILVPMSWVLLIGIPLLILIVAKLRGIQFSERKEPDPTKP